MYCKHEKRRKDCELSTNEFRLELLTDIDMLLMVEKGIRGGITQLNDVPRPIIGI